MRAYARIAVRTRGREPGKKGHVEKDTFGSRSGNHETVHRPKEQPPQRLGRNELEKIWDFSGEVLAIAGRFE